MHERFSDRARHAMALATREAGRLRHDYIGPEHILLGLVAEKDCLANAVLMHLHVNLDDVRDELNRRIKAGSAGDEIGRRPYNPQTRATIELAISEARKLGHKYVGTEHLLLGLLHEESGLPAQLLAARGVSLDSLREELLGILRGSPEPADDDSALRHGEFEWIHQQELARAFASTDVWHTLILAIDSSNRLGHGQLAQEHLLLAMLRRPNGVVARLFAQKGLTADWVREQITAQS